MDGARAVCDSLHTWSDLQAMVGEAVPEGVCLECRTLTGTTLSKDTKDELAQITSAMSNTSGGVIMLGLATTAAMARGRGVVPGLEPIGNFSKLAARVEIALPQLTIPPYVGAEVRVIKKTGSDAGIVAIFVASAPGDPLRSAIDDHFYYWTGTR